MELPEERQKIAAELSGPNSELEKRARQVGRIAGTAVALVRNARRRTGDSSSTFGSNIKSKVAEFRGTASARADDWRRAAQKRAADLGQHAKFRMENARTRANQFGREYPWHLVFAAGILGFVLGATLRMRRSNRG